MLLVDVGSSVFARVCDVAAILDVCNIAVEGMRIVHDGDGGGGGRRGRGGGKELHVGHARERENKRASEEGSMMRRNGGGGGGGEEEKGEQARTVEDVATKGYCSFINK